MQLLTILCGTSINDVMTYACVCVINNVLCVHMNNIDKEPCIIFMNLYLVNASKNIPEWVN